MMPTTASRDDWAQPLAETDLFGVEAPTPPKATERSVLDALALRYGRQNGNGPRYAFGEHVKSEAGFWAQRSADLIAIDLWPSSGCAMHGHEVKVSRSDWLRELKDPTKAEAFRPYMDFWWLVVSDLHIVRDDMPAGWGLIVAYPDGTTRITKRAARITPLPMTRSMQAAFARAVAKTAERRAAR